MTRSGPAPTEKPPAPTRASAAKRLTDASSPRSFKRVDASLDLLPVPRPSDQRQPEFVATRLEPIDRTALIIPESRDFVRTWRFGEYR